MELIFADDSRQKKPSRVNMGGPLLAIGGLHVPAAQVGPFECALRSHCASIGFPANEQFKWSPSKDDVFQRKNLNGERRNEFFLHLLSLAAEHGATITVVIVDSSKRMASKKSKTHEEDVTTLFLERCDWACGGKVGLPIIAKPGGGAKDEKKFVAECMALIQEGTEYVDLKSLAIGILTAPSKQIRLLQLADVVTSCTVSRVAGENQFSPPVFKSILPLFRKDGDRIGGVGLKIHPDFSYLNLYHWVLGDAYFMKSGTGRPLPLKFYPYSGGPGEAAKELKAV
jgi:hypothetical protein